MRTSLCNFVRSSSSRQSSLRVYPCCAVPPRWRLQPEHQAAVEGEVVRFHCQAAGVPQPVTTWSVASGRQQASYTVTTRGGRTHDTEILGNGTLVLWRVEAGDQGQYTCSAANDVGEPISKTVNLKINGKPRPQHLILTHRHRCCRSAPAVRDVRGRRGVGALRARGAAGVPRKR